MYKSLLAGAVFLAATTLFAADSPGRKPGEYSLGPDSLPQEGVPHGKLEGPLLFHSQIITNTVREYWIFVPAQYTPDKPACVMVFSGWRRSRFHQWPSARPPGDDNLIAKKEMPVTIGIFITPGIRGDKFIQGGGGKLNTRSFEYDSLTDLYARFLCEGNAARGGQALQLDEGPRRARDCRPEQRRNLRVYRRMGTPRPVSQSLQRRRQLYRHCLPPGARRATHGTRGDLYPTLIRNNPIKPLKVFLEDGTNDLNNMRGNWFLANQQMLSALEWANSNADEQHTPGPRYQVNHNWGRWRPFRCPRRSDPSRCHAMALERLPPIGLAAGGGRGWSEPDLCAKRLTIECHSPLIGSSRRRNRESFFYFS